MISFYQHLPSYINPIIFSIGSFNIRWYSVMYLIAIFVFYILAKWRIKKGENGYVSYLINDFIIYSVVGMIVGARLGYVFFYDFSYFQNHLSEIFIPGANGISGLSYHGGLVGIIIASLIFIKRNRLSFWDFADFVVPAISAAYFFGRIGNFLNGELYGRITDSWLGMYFFGQLRHPSQLYEAFFEGIILFIILWILRNKSKFPGYLLCLYLFGYGFFRFFIEFLREPDEQIGSFFSWLSLGQLFSLAMIFIAILLFFMRKISVNKAE